MKLISNKKTWLIEKGDEQIVIPKDHPDRMLLIMEYFKEGMKEISERLKKIKVK